MQAAKKGIYLSESFQYFIISKDSRACQGYKAAMLAPGGRQPLDAQFIDDREIVFC